MNERADESAIQKALTLNNQMSAQLSYVADELMRLHKRLKKSNAFIRQIAWRVNLHDENRWSGPDVTANAAAFFNLTIEQFTSELRKDRAV